MVQNVKVGLKSKFTESYLISPVSWDKWEVNGEPAVLLQELITDLSTLLN